MPFDFKATESCVERAHEYVEDVGKALATEGGHLWIGAYGGILYYGRGCRLSGFDADAMKIAAVAAGLPVIDLRRMEDDAGAAAVLQAPNVAVGEPADPEPWHGFSLAPLAHVAALYRTAGAEVLNMPAPSRASTPTNSPPRS